MTDPLLGVESLWVRYGRRPIVRRTRAVPWTLHDVSLQVSAGQTVGIVGESGSGKSTLARALIGLVRITQGRILLEGASVDHRRDPAQRRAVQMVFQDPYSSLNPRMTVRQTLEEAIRFHRVATGPSVAQRSASLCDLVQLPASASDKHPHQLSGGQRQRVAIARALATNPRLLVADEPTSALDVSVQAAILNLFCELRSELGLSLVLISHNLAVVRHVCDTTLVMHDGRIVEQGATDEVLTTPQHAYTRALIAAVPSL